MTNEEMQKAMGAIFEQEARSSAKIDAITGAQKEAEKQWAHTEEGIRALLIIAEIHEREIQANTLQILSLGETTRATDERLNALTNVVER
jgi:hypothetical protein